MEETGVMVEVNKSDNISIGKYERIINAQYMKNE